jgi:hypothetical protein
MMGFVIAAFVGWRIDGVTRPLNMQLALQLFPEALLRIAQVVHTSAVGRDSVLCRRISN